MLALTLTCSVCTTRTPTLTINGCALCAVCAHAMIDATSPVLVASDARVASRAVAAVRVLASYEPRPLSFDQLLRKVRGNPETLDAALDLAIADGRVTSSRAGYVVTERGLASVEETRTANAHDSHSLEPRVAAFVSSILGPKGIATVHA